MKDKHQKSIKKNESPSKISAQMCLIKSQINCLCYLLLLHEGKHLKRNASDRSDHKVIKQNLEAPS